MSLAGVNSVQIVKMFLQGTRLTNAIVALLFDVSDFAHEIVRCFFSSVKRATED